MTPRWHAFGGSFPGRGPGLLRYSLGSCLNRQRPAVLALLLGSLACGDDGGAASEAGSDPGTGADGDATHSTSSADYGDDVGPIPDAGSSTIDEPEEVELRGDCPSIDRVGGFLVTSDATASAVSGDAADIPNPVAAQQEVMADGPCRLLQPIQPFCDPPCGGGELCSPQEVCITAPSSQNLGTVWILGLLSEVQMEAVEPGNNYFDTMLPFPGFEPGNVVQLVSGDGYYGELSLYGIGSEALSGVADLPISETEALTVVWDAPTEESYATVRFTLSIDQHGVTPVQAICDFEDTGTGTVSPEMIAAIRAAGISGFPNATLSRRTVDSTDVSGGCIDFVVASRRKPEITVQGHTACLAPTQCPDGQTCNIEIQTCVPK
ncbi:MAG: hypothetical protein JKY37_29525 [Nannocystaceae bacterium]|nr:hypothetical protein [Nannocystaceae bacterium]